MTNSSYVEHLQDIIKANKKKKRFNIPFGVYLFIIAASCIPAVIIRYIQLRDGTNLKTGYYNGDPTLNFVFFGILVFLFIVSVILTLIDRNRYQVSFCKSNTLAIRLMAAIAAVFSVISGIKGFYSMGTGVDGVSATDFFIIMFAFLSSGGFSYMVWRIGRKDGGASDVLLCMPCLWSCVVLLSMFLKHTVVATVTENIINILWAASCCVFLLNAAKIMADVDNFYSGRTLIISGVAAIITGLCATLPPFLLAIIEGRVYNSEHVLTASALDFVILIFIIVFLAQYLIARKIKESDK